MFTGIISDVGELLDIKTSDEARLSIACHYAAESIAIGASIACSGICLTVVEVERLAKDRAAFMVQASGETLKKTTIGRWKAGRKLNLERALKAGDELGGHLVSGHVDGLATIASIKAEGQSRRIGLRISAELARFIAPKGSVCLDGTSLTVNDVDGEAFNVNLIAHTLKVTTWHLAREGDAVNVEIDMLARYVARLRELQGR
jgi:riboflavin synthase